jgi:hypothetical protein
MTENETIWNRLKLFQFLNYSLNQSIVENRLPFGTKRNLSPLIITEAYPVLKPSDFIISFKDPNLFKRIEPKIEANCVNRFKFIPHKVISSYNSIPTKEQEPEIQFDPSAILFFNPKSEVLKTNLTSNANGSVSNDKNNLAAILKQSCWLLSFTDLTNNFTKFNLPQIQNNKLRSLKYVEFISEEWSELKGFGEEVGFISITRIENHDISGDYSVLKSKRNFKLLNLFIINKDGKLKFSSLKEETFVLISNSIYKTTLKIESSDTIFMFKGEGNCFEDVLKLNCDLSDDFEGKALELIKNAEKRKILKNYNFLDSLIISRVKFLNEFDESFDLNLNLNLNPTVTINYLSHLDTKIGTIVNYPIPGPFGCTTRHSVVYRRGYFAALHHDASKINRFPDTINYIIRKMGNPSNLGKRMEQEGDESVLKRISDIQYFAYFLKKEGKYYLALGGGAKCVILSRKLNLITVHEMPILMELPILSSKDQIILLSPHFPPSNLIKSIQAPTIQEWIKRLLQVSEVDLSSFKVSLGHFEMVNEK